jgi:hypothetical protein
MSAIAVIAGVSVLLVLVGFLVMLPLIADILFIQQNWEAYWFWYPILALLSRIVCVFCAIFCFIYPFVNGEITMWIDGISFLLLAIWGIPLLVDALYALIFVPLSGIQLQRTILNFALVEFWLVATTSSFRHYSQKKEETKP